MKKKKFERERERERTFFMQEKYAQNGRDWKIYNKRMRIKRAKIKEDKRAK